MTIHNETASRPQAIGTSLKYGGKPYTVLCYAKMKKTWFTRVDYNAMQLHRARMCKDSQRSLDTLHRNGFLDKMNDNSRVFYQITSWGDHALYALGKNKQKQLSRINTVHGARGNAMRAIMNDY